MDARIDLGLDHEHAFFAHEDPRYLICACGQYAVRTRDMIGQSSVRLIEPPQPVLRLDTKLAQSA
ncbi:hypothetical protein [Longivirga aurantiaca]|uniref:Uncharacterized protein n=1 Tax=Longivirga aurantiaca TaxID=1837743 RepID=A0ABW1SWT7_9ACTN